MFLNCTKVITGFTRKVHSCTHTHTRTTEYIKDNNVKHSYCHWNALMYCNKRFTGRVGNCLGPVCLPVCVCVLLCLCVSPRTAFLPDPCGCSGWPNHIANHGWGIYDGQLTSVRSRMTATLKSVCELWHMWTVIFLCFVCFCLWLINPSLFLLTPPFPGFFFSPV